ncbi:uncharacterized protein FYW49_011703 [Xenentodon cancila]
MAAVDPPKSPKRQKTPAEEVQTSGEKAEAVESGCSSPRKDEPARGKPAGGPGSERGADVGSGGVHSGAGVEAAAGADTTTCVSPDDLTAAEKMAEAPAGEERAFDWSEAEDDEHETAKTSTTPVENDPCDLHKAPEPPEEVKQDKHVDGNTTTTAAAEKVSSEKSGEKSSEKRPVEGPAGDADDTEDVTEDDEDTDQEEEADLVAKQKQYQLVCKDCGKIFNRRETFNLHRHFHAHEDELTPLTCKECGLTFQHRSSLIKHRNQHREREEQLLTPKKEVQTNEEGRFQCAECQRIFYAVGKLRDHNCNNTVEKPYHCPLCRQEFQFKVSITKHMMAHSQESIFTCQECNQTFPNTMALRFHQRCHTALKPYECPECGMVFKHYSVMEDHRRKHTDSGRSHLCNICGKSFKYSSLLHQHQYLHTGQKPFRCPECGKKFAFAQNMKAHCRQHRLGETNSFGGPASKQTPVSAHEAVKAPGKENAHQSEEQKPTFNCPLCPQTFCLPANLRAHMLIHEAEYEKLDRSPRASREVNKYWEKGHTCPHCPSVYRDESSLKVHLLSVHKSTAQCLEKMATQPKKEFTPLGSDNVQEKWKSEGLSIKSFKCSECGKTFRHRSVLELHMRIHSKDKPYQCKVCGKGFRFSSYLQQHLIIHTGKKPYKCPDCGKDFAFLQNMRTHQKLHQEKPFRCTHCRKGYSDETQLQHHMLSHNGDKPHKCELCDKSFGLAYLLRDHMNTHTGERPHRCDECHKTFSWFSSLLVHQKIHARKKQGFSQYSSLPMSARVRGRGRRGGRLVWGWSRPLGGSGIIAPQQPLYPVSPLRDAELHRRAPQPPSSMLPSRMDLQGRQQKEPWLSEQHTQPVQWKVDGGEVMPVPSAQQQHGAPQQTRFDSSTQPGLQQHLQRSPGWADIPLLAQSSPQSSDPHMKESASSVVGSHPMTVPKKSSPSAASELVQHRQHKPTIWSSTPTSTVLASTSAVQHDFSSPSLYTDGAALWSVRPTPIANSQNSPNKLGQELQLPRWSGAAPVSSQKEPSTPPKKEERVWDISNPQVISSTVTQPEKPWNGCEPQKPWASGLAGASTSAQIDQSSAMPISTPVSHSVANTLWEIQTPPGIPKTINSTEKLVNNQDFQLQQKQVSPGWASVQPATQKVPISIQYEPHRFGQGMGTPVWGFQNNPVGPQTLLPGQLKAGSGQELQQQPMAVMSERPHMPQTLPLPQLAPQTEPHKLGSRLPFAPERLLQCMICGCSLPRELDLQMHYLQHAQGEI